MSGLDLIIAFIVLVGLWRGFQVGLIKSLFAMFGWLIALIAATRLADDIAPQMSGFVSAPVLQSALAFLVVVLVVMVVMHFVGWLASYTIKGLKLGIVDKMFGGVFGAAKNVLVILVFMSLATPLLIQMPIWKQSILAPELLPYAPYAQSFASQLLGEAWQQVNQP